MSLHYTLGEVVLYWELAHMGSNAYNVLLPGWGAFPADLLISTTVNPRFLTTAWPAKYALENELIAPDFAKVNFDTLFGTWSPGNGFKDIWLPRLKTDFETHTYLTHAINSARGVHGQTLVDKDDTGLYMIASNNVRRMARDSVEKRFNINLSHSLWEHKIIGLK